MNSFQSPYLTHQLYCQYCHLHSACILRPKQMCERSVNDAKSAHVAQWARVVFAHKTSICPDETFLLCVICDDGPWAVSGGQFWPEFYWVRQWLLSAWRWVAPSGLRCDEVKLNWAIVLRFVTEWATHWDRIRFQPGQRCVYAKIAISLITTLPHCSMSRNASRSTQQGDSCAIRMHPKWSDHRQTGIIWLLACVLTQIRTLPPLPTSHSTQTLIPSQPQITSIVRRFKHSTIIIMVIRNFIPLIAVIYCQITSPTMIQRGSELQWHWQT